MMTSCEMCIRDRRNFARFRDAISEQNGWYMSFENPEYTVGIIKINNADADNILSEHDLNIPLNYLYDFAKAFCCGANIEMKDVYKRQHRS